MSSKVKKNVKEYYGDVSKKYRTRLATIDDVSSIVQIYNEGIEDRIATLETKLKTYEEMNEWFKTEVISIR